jgi:cell shape-determining protein MreC
MEISVGSKDKTEKGMIVVDGDVFIGKVVSVSNRRSLIMLPTDEELTIPVKTSRGAKGIVTGLAGQDIILDKVLQKDPLFLDDLVATSGEEDIPPNLLIGKISYIMTSDVAVYKQAKVTPLVDYQKEQTVFVIGEP